jgi:hypothetical protein
MILETSQAHLHGDVSLLPQVSSLKVEQSSKDWLERYIQKGKYQSAETN